MEAFHIKRPTPTESFSSRIKSRRTIRQQSGCDSGSEIRAASLAAVNKPLTTTTTTTKETTTSPIASINSAIVSAREAKLHIPQLQLSLPLTQPQLQPLAPTISSSSSASSAAAYQHIHKISWSCFSLRHDLACIMLTMLFLISIVLSGNPALAAQRESFKPKNTNSINNNANAIFNEIGSGSAGNVNAGGLSNSNSNGNGNAVSHSKANNISNGNANVNSNNNIGPSNVNTQKQQRV